MTGDWIIREVGAGDGALLSRLHATCFTHEEAWPVDGIALLLQTPGCSAFVVDGADFVPCGLLILRQASDEAEIITLGVAPEHRRAGAGLAFLDFSRDHLSRSGVRHIYLEVRAQNTAAQALYKKAGFEFCGYRRNYYSDGSNAQVMRLVLL